MNENLANLLTSLVEIVQNHSTRIAALEREEFVENADDASLTETANALLAQLQTPASISQVVPSDQM
jgi:formate dehydrogenase maturation protein FdhE